MSNRLGWSHHVRFAPIATKSQRRAKWRSGPEADSNAQDSDLVELDPDRLNNLLTDVGLSAHECGKIFRRFAGCRLHSGGGELVAYGFAAKHRDDLIVQSIHDRRRRLRRRDDTLPDAEVEAGQRFRDRRYLRRQRYAFASGKRD